jgi:hypothetical protein
MTQESKVGQESQAVQQHSLSLNLVAEYELHLRLWKLKVKIRITYMIDANTQHILRDQQACLLCYDYWWEIWAGSGCTRWLVTDVELKHWPRRILRTVWLRPKMVLAESADERHKCCIWKIAQLFTRMQDSLLGYKLLQWYQTRSWSCHIAGGIEGLNHDGLTDDWNG